MDEIGKIISRRLVELYYIFLYLIKAKAKAKAKAKVQIPLEIAQGVIKIGLKPCAII